MAEYSFDSFRYWFVPTSAIGKWKVLGYDDVVIVDCTGSVEIPAVLPGDISHTILEADFSEFQKRPEFLVGQPIDLNDQYDFSLKYQSLLVGTYLSHVMSSCTSLDEMKSRYMQIGNQVEGRLNRMLDWLKQTDFYSAPASTKYHECFRGGLATHSLKVYNKTLDLICTDSFHECSVVSAALVALVHDWCKTSYYESYMKNVKDDKTGQWHQEENWTVNQKGVPLGHGVSSMFLASKFFNLSTEEALAIRWHMGRWHCSELEVSELQKANEACPLVYLLQFADQLACTKY